MHWRAEIRSRWSPDCLPSVAHRRRESGCEGKNSRRREPSAGRNHHPWAVAGRGRRQSLPLVQQSHPTRFVAGVGNLWHTSAHKGNPLFRRRAPAPSTVDPRGLLTIRAAPEGRQVVRRPLAINGRNTDQWNGGERHSWRNDLLVPWPVSARRNAHTVAEGDARWGVPRGAGRFASPSVKSRRGRGVHWHQDALGAARRWREALRLPVEDSAGSVPLQSG